MGLVLGGGGARGAAHVGMIKSIRVIIICRHCNVPPSGFIYFHCLFVCVNFRKQVSLSTWSAELVSGRLWAPFGVWKKT